ADHDPRGAHRQGIDVRAEGLGGAGGPEENGSGEDVYPGGRELPHCRWIVPQSDPERSPCDRFHQVAAPVPARAQSRSAAASSATRAPTAPAPPSPAARTTREPTITPSAISPTARACSPVEMPKPTATGTSVDSRTRRTVSARSGAISSRSPVVPV